MPCNEAATMCKTVVSSLCSVGAQAKPVTETGSPGNASLAPGEGLATAGQGLVTQTTGKTQAIDPTDLNPFNPIYFAFDPTTRDLYKNTFGTRHHTTGQGWSDGSHGPVETPGKSWEEKGKIKGHVYNETVGTNAAFYVSHAGEAPSSVPDNEAFVALQHLSKLNAIKVGGFGGGMKSLDYFNSIGQVCPMGDSEFYTKIGQGTFNIKDQAMAADYLNALERVVDPLVEGILNMSNQQQFVVHWDGDELYDTYGNCFNNYGPLVWALAANLGRRGKLAALLAVKNARTKWTKAIGSEPPGTVEDQWYKAQNGKAREDFASRYFRESKICEMMGFVKQRGGSVPFYCLTHSTEKNKHVSQRQDDSHYGYFGASVQSAMAQGPDSIAVVVMFGGGAVIYNELSSDTWKDGVAKTKTKGYKPGTRIIALDVQRKEQTERCMVFEKEGEPDLVFDKVKGKQICV